MNFHLFTRRLHLYLAMFLLPWFFVYGVSSALFSHAEFFHDLVGDPAPVTLFDRHYEIAVPEHADLRQIGQRIMDDNGLTGAFGAYQPNPRELHVYRFSFWSADEIVYYPDQKRLVAKERRKKWDGVLRGMHARGGFEQASVLNDAWGVTVDLVCFGILIWIASGIYMWWKLPKTRAWGTLALAAGGLSFLVFLLAL